ncbi:MAG: prepilin-type N-terminal cleavage/methylation domain-containing protein [Desulfitobacteriaceae bacterium]|nr:prepilin-type N-terminal cleavage/methylation domain-containing protein [Desulfitobacteriaceae bacterium]
MLQKIRKSLKNSKGFTLIELMVVVIILGILAAIAIPRFMIKKAEAEAVKTAADIKIIQNAVELYYFDKNVYPNTTEELVDAGYLKENLKDSAGNESYSIDEDKGKVQESS